MPRSSTTALLAAILLLGGPARVALASPNQGGNRIRSGVLEGRSIDTTFRMEKGGLVDLEALSGAIIVTGTTGSEIRVRASADDGRVRLRGSPTLVTLRTVSDHGAPGNVRYEVTVPAGVRVLMKTTSAQLTATGVRGDVEIESIAGDIRLEDIGGAADVEVVSGQVVAARLTGGATIETMSGDITLTGAEGDVDLESTSGNITLTGLRSGVVSAETISGDVRFQGSIESDGRYEFASHSGTIRLALPPATGAMLSLSTYSGTMNSEFPITLQQGSSAGQDKQLRFRLGSGSARITAESFSGSIIITRGTGRD
jgi:hypothetical protein